MAVHAEGFYLLDGPDIVVGGLGAICDGSDLVDLGADGLEVLVGRDGAVGRTVGLRRVDRHGIRGFGGRDVRCVWL